ncbi:excalibur calcium-binding domain-containing protein [Sphingobium terrigena]|nr:excalibur calcium-binding domain-containing protein [Sphingobium terrigena]
MSFKKPFRAVPVQLSPAYRAQQQRESRKASALLLLAVFAVGLVAALSLHWLRSEPAAPLPPEPAMIEAPIGMPEPVVRERPMSAAELDAQQPSAGGGHAIARVERGIVRSQATATVFRDCRAAWAAGAAPIYRGQPGYDVSMDGDLDGIACEPVRR